MYPTEVLDRRPYVRLQVSQPFLMADVLTQNSLLTSRQKKISFNSSDEQSSFWALEKEEESASLRRSFKITPSVTRIIFSIKSAAIRSGTETFRQLSWTMCCARRRSKAVTSPGTSKDLDDT